MDLNGVLGDLKKRLVEVYGNNLTEVVLFGSAARGEATDESDIDLLVVLRDIPDPGEEFDKVFKIEREIEERFEDKVVISLVLATEAEYRAKAEPLFLNVQREGVRV